MYPGTVLYLPLLWCDSWTKATVEEATGWGREEVHSVSPASPIFPRLALIIFTSLAAITTYVPSPIYLFRYINIPLEWFSTIFLISRRIPKVFRSIIKITRGQRSILSSIIPGKIFDNNLSNLFDTNEEITISSIYIYVHKTHTGRRIVWMAVSAFPTPKGVSKDASTR